MTTVEEPTVGTRPRLPLWAGVSIGVLAWVAVYRLNAPFWDWLLFSALGLDPQERLGETLRFFFYDTVKILLLLSGVVFVATVLRSFVSIEHTRRVLGGSHSVFGYAAAAGLGVATPFCSCSAVPVFVGFVAAGVPLGITMTFLIASPMVNEVALTLLLGMFGWQVAGLYVVAGLAIAVVAGVVLGRMRPERWIEPFVLEATAGTLEGEAERPTPAERVELGRREVLRIVRKVLPYLVVGIALGALIHGWAPEDLFERYAAPGSPLAVPFAVLVGVPLYSNAAGILPLVEALHDKGIEMGTLLAFMMAVVALSLPELILLRRVLKPRMIGAFVGVVAAGILAVGFLFNAIL